MLLLIGAHVSDKRPLLEVIYLIRIESLNSRVAEIHSLEDGGKNEEASRAVKEAQNYAKYTNAYGKKEDVDKLDVVKKELAEAETRLSRLSHQG